jgi:hypothetical protein
MAAMNVEDLRAKAQRCRDLQRIAVRQEVRNQLREWAEDYEEEAEAVESRSGRRLKADVD